MSDEITVVRVEEVGKQGAKRTVHHLSNGWFINESGNNKRIKRFALYKPGVGNQGPRNAKFVTSDDKLKHLLEYASKEGGDNVSDIGR